MPKIDSFEAPREEVQVDDLALHNVYQVCTLHGEPTIKQRFDHESGVLPASSPGSRPGITGQPRHKVLGVRYTHTPEEYCYNQLFPIAVATLSLVSKGSNHGGIVSCC